MISLFIIEKKSAQGREIKVYKERDGKKERRDGKERKRGRNEKKNGEKLKKKLGGKKSNLSKNILPLLSEGAYL